MLHYLNDQSLVGADWELNYVVEMNCRCRLVTLELETAPFILYLC